MHFFRVGDSWNALWDSWNVNLCATQTDLETWTKFVLANIFFRQKLTSSFTNMREKTHILSRRKKHSDKRMEPLNENSQFFFSIWWHDDGLNFSWFLTSLNKMTPRALNIQISGLTSEDDRTRKTFPDCIWLWKVDWKFQLLLFDMQN